MKEGNETDERVTHPDAEFKPEYFVPPKIPSDSEVNIPRDLETDPLRLADLLLRPEGEGEGELDLIKPESHRSKIVDPTESFLTTCLAFPTIRSYQ
jgi:hypothetical protein